MTTDPKKDRLACIDDFIISEILSTPDAEILSQISEAEIEEVQRRIGKVKLASGRQRFEEIKAQIKQEKASARVLTFDRAKVRSELEKMIASDSALRGKLTLAARNLDGDAENDLEGILEDLAELDADANEPDDKK